MSTSKLTWATSSFFSRIFWLLSLWPLSSKSGKGDTFMSLWWVRCCCACSCSVFSSNHSSRPSIGSYKFSDGLPARFIAPKPGIFLAFFFRISVSLALKSGTLCASVSILAYIYWIRLASNSLSLALIFSSKHSERSTPISFITLKGR